MGLEDAFDLGDGFLVLVGTVVRGHRQFALGSLHVAAPVGDEAVGLDRLGVVRIAALASITDNDMIRNAGSGRHMVDGLDEAVFGRHGVHTVGHAFQVEGIAAGGDGLEDFGSCLEQVNWGFDEFGAEAAQPVGSNFATAKRGRDENDAIHFGPVLENEGIRQKLPGFG